MKTKLGEYLTNLRIERQETLKTMAEKIGVSSAFLSAVENGHKEMPKNLEKRLGESYCLSTNQLKELSNVIFESKNTIKLDMKKLSNSNKELVLSFTRNFNKLDEQTSKKILNILNKNINKEEV